MLEYWKITDMFETLVTGLKRNAYLHVKWNSILIISTNTKSFLPWPLKLSLSTSFHRLFVDRQKKLLFLSLSCGKCQFIIANAHVFLFEKKIITWHVTGVWKPSVSVLMDDCSLGDGCSCVYNPLARVKISASITESVFDPWDLWRQTSVRRSFNSQLMGIFMHQRLMYCSKFSRRLPNWY